MIHLYVKQCSHCDLRYFGKTIADPHVYPGSGVDWTAHLLEYDATPITLDVWSFESVEEASAFAKSFSTKHNIVESASWANRVPENAKNGPDGVARPDHSEWMQNWQDNPYRRKRFGADNLFYGKKHIVEARTKMSEFQSQSYDVKYKDGAAKAKKHSEWMKSNNPFKGRKHTEESKRKMSEARKRRSM